MGILMSWEVPAIHCAVFPRNKSSQSSREYLPPPGWVGEAVGRAGGLRSEATLSVMGCVQCVLSIVRKGVSLGISKTKAVHLLLRQW